MSDIGLRNRGSGVRIPLAAQKCLDESAPAVQGAEAEEWRPVVGFEGWYEVSDLGRVRRVAPGKGTRVGKILRSSPDTGGYPHVGLTRATERRYCQVHLLVADAFLGPRAPGLEVDHFDGNKANPRLSNLEIVDHPENVRRSHASGRRRPWGSGHKGPRGRLTPADVIAIRASHETTYADAKRYSVSQALISQIRTGKAWRHLLPAQAVSP